MTVGELCLRLSGVDPSLPVAILLDTDGSAMDIADPAGVIVTIRAQRRPFANGADLSGREVLVLVASGSVDHAALLQKVPT